MITSQNSVLLHFHKQLFNCVLYNCLFFALFARALHADDRINDYQHYAADAVQSCQQYADMGAQVRKSP